MSPLSHSEGHDAPRLIYEAIPCEAAVIDDIVIGFEDAVGEPVVAHELPDILDWVQLRAARRQWQEGDVGRDDQFARAMPPGLIEQQDGMRARCDVEGDLFEMQAHRLAVAAGHDDASSLAFGGADRTEQPGRGSALIPWR